MLFVDQTIDRMREFRNNLREAKVAKTIFSWWTSSHLGQS